MIKGRTIIYKNLRSQVGIPNPIHLVPTGVTRAGVPEMEGNLFRFKRQHIVCSITWHTQILNEMFTKFKSYTKDVQNLDQQDVRIKGFNTSIHTMEDSTLRQPRPGKNLPIPKLSLMFMLQRGDRTYTLFPFLLAFEKDSARVETSKSLTIFRVYKIGPFGELFATANYIFPAFFPRRFPTRRSSLFHLRTDSYCDRCLSK